MFSHPAANARVAAVGFVSPRRRKPRRHADVSFKMCDVARLTLGTGSLVRQRTFVVRNGCSMHINGKMSAMHCLQDACEPAIARPRTPRSFGPT